MTPLRRSRHRRPPLMSSLSSSTAAGVENRHVGSAFASAANSIPPPPLPLPPPMGLGRDGGDAGNSASGYPCDSLLLTAVLFWCSPPPLRCPSLCFRLHVCRSCKRFLQVSSFRLFNSSSLLFMPLVIACFFTSLISSLSCSILFSHRFSSALAFSASVYANANVCLSSLSPLCLSLSFICNCVIICLSVCPSLFDLL